MIINIMLNKFVFFKINIVKPVFEKHRFYHQNLVYQDRF